VTRGIRAALLAGPRPDVLHLRMADPGSLAGAVLARELGIPIVFTLAPDPHGSIAAAEAAGSLDRRTFVSADAKDGLWFRADLVGRLARRARQLVLFPRAGRAAELEALTGVDLTSGPPRHTIVPEGIDVARIDVAASVVRRASAGDGQDTPGVIGELARAIARLPRHRHGLPLVISVGRLHAVKGMSRLVEAFAFDAELAARANLVIVGGQLASPSAAEATELERIRQRLERDPALGERLILLGHRPHDDVALVLATARRGWGSLIGPAGVYACASAKEEFGLAIVEAMAAGLPVVAPAAGGPATYVEPGVTGILVDTTHPGALAGAIGSALDLALDGRSAAVARAVVECRYRLERMAGDLGAVYRVAAGPRSLATRVASAWTKVA
jgi:glycosyltransferase involved in cell wall biosynthesis